MSQFTSSVTRLATAVAGTVSGMSPVPHPRTCVMVPFPGALRSMRVRTGVPMEAVELHERVAKLVNAGDVEGLLDLYEPDARVVNEDGSLMVGREAFREFINELVPLGGRMEITTRFVVDMGDIALLSNEWHFRADDVELSGITAEVARRQADGRWLYVIDNPYAVALPEV